MATHEYVPQNSGLVRPIKIIAERGSLANPTFPSATIARFCPGNMVADTLMHALAPAIPDQVSAGVGNLKVIAYTGVSAGQHWVYMDITEGSWGGRQGKDGMSCVDTIYANTRNNPIEDIESHYPLQVTRYEIRDGGLSGPGKWRGGVGSVREIKFLTAAHMSLEGDGHKFRPWGFKGGAEGWTGGVDYVNAQTGEVVQLPSKIQSRSSNPGDIYRTLSALGGGYGPAGERDTDKVLDDVLDELISIQQAKDDYGVVINPLLMKVDQDGTAALRRQMTVGAVAD
jgi:N-methylhydantoinase B